MHAGRDDVVPDSPGGGLQVDLPAMLDRLGGDLNFAVECAELLQIELPAMLEAVRAAFRAGSTDKLCLAAHTLKGAVSNFCEDGPAKTAGRLDTLGRRGQLDEAFLLLPQLEEQLDALVAALRELRVHS